MTSPRAVAVDRLGGCRRRESTGTGDGTRRDRAAGATGQLCQHHDLIAGQELDFRRSAQPLAKEGNVRVGKEASTSRHRADTGTLGRCHEAPMRHPQQRRYLVRRVAVDNRSLGSECDTA